MTRPRTPGNPLAQDFTLIPLLRFAFPTIATMLFMGLYTMTDTIFISRLVNTNALSAVNIVCPVINIMVGLGTMTATGGSAIIARRMGEGQERQAKQDFTLIVLFGAFLGILVAVIHKNYIWRKGCAGFHRIFKTVHIKGFYGICVFVVIKAQSNAVFPEKIGRAHV